MPHVLIAGAGIGGLTAALAIARIGATVTVLERAQAIEPIGAGLQLSPNATRVLASLGLLPSILSIASRPSAIEVRAARSARAIVTMPLVDAEARWGSPYLVAHRADLQQALLTAVKVEPAIEVHFGTNLAGFGTKGEGVTAAAKQGLLTREFKGDALIGADGIRSTVRTKLIDGAADHPTETGRTAWRAMIASDALPEAFQAGARERETGLWLGQDAHLVHYPLQDGRRLNVVAITREATQGGAPDAIWSRPGDPKLLRERFAGWHRSARALIAAADSWTTWPLYDRAPLPAWNAGPVALLGDAAHPILPFLAQGAAQAIEDAGALAQALAATRSSSEAMALYSQARRDRATRVQESSREQGRFYHLSGPQALVRNTGMRVLGPRRLLARYDWLYGRG